MYDLKLNTRRIVILIIGFVLMAIYGYTIYAGIQLFGLSSGVQQALIVALIAVLGVLYIVFRSKNIKQ